MARLDADVRREQPVHAGVALLPTVSGQDPFVPGDLGHRLGPLSGLRQGVEVLPMLEQAAAASDATRGRHLAHLLALAEELEPLIVRPHGPTH